MDRGGAETWLINVLRNSDRNRVRMDFLVHTRRPAAYDPEVLQLGSRILPCPDPHNLVRYSRQFRDIVRQFGPYDAAHSHVHHYSGIVLGLARLAGIPERIAHSHTDARAIAERATPVRKAYLLLSQRLIRAHCTRGLAASKDAARGLFGEDWEHDPRFRVLPCSIDLSPFRRATDRHAVRAELGFQPGEIVFGHVGGFHPVKNHPFLIQIAAEITRCEPRARFLFVGDGPLRPAIEQEIRQARLADRVVLTGPTNDVPRLLTGAMDAFLFPSFYEGLPLALIEAQAANLPATVSDSISSEANIVRGLVRRLSLHEPASVWAASALRHLDRSSDALSQVERSPYNLAIGIRELMHVYGVRMEDQIASRDSPAVGERLS
jgi:glycosyltransferase involved in cell wall biosynthesis